MKRFISAVYLLLGLGMLLYGISLVWERYTPLPASKRATGTAAGQHPQLSIPSAQIVLPIYSANIVNNTWETTKLGVSHLSTSPKAGDRGNSVYYGHNWPRILSRLHQVKPGDRVFVTGENGKTHRFTVAYVFVVHPDQTEIFAPTADSRLTIYTCTGFLDSKRLVVTALLDPVPLSTTNTSL